MIGGRHPAVRLLIAIAAAAAAVSPAAAQVRLRTEGGEASVRVLSWRDIPFRTVVRQEHDFSCGSAALATLLTYHYGRPTTEAQAFSVMFATGDQEAIQKVGFSMLDMKRYLASIGLPSDGFRIRLDELAQLRRPAIVLINLGSYRHFVVVKGVDAERVLVGDPALGLRTYRRSDFEKMWNGVAFGLHQPQGLAQPAFNQTDEWGPWARAPLQAGARREPVSALTDHLMPLYQLTRLRELESAYPGTPP